MTEYSTPQNWLLGLASFAALTGTISFSGDIAFAQSISPDNTLGAERSVINPHDTLGQLIEGGARREGNLFHSFDTFNVDFNVDVGQGVYFDQPTGIERIFSRVTGRSLSKILGTLGVWDKINKVVGNADLFLINPNGIIFGPNASLNLGGSFLATTATSVDFGQGNQFSAINPSPALLTVNIPIGLQFRENSGQITNQSLSLGFGLQVLPGKTLALIGGDILSQGGIIVANEGRVELGSVAIGQVSLNPIEKGWALAYDGVTDFRDIQLTQGSSIGANGEGGGEIHLQGRRVTLADGSSIFATVVFGSQDGEILDVNALESLELIGTNPNPSRNSSSLVTSTFSDGDAGDIRIKTGRLLLKDGAIISTGSIFIPALGDPRPKGQAGDLFVEAPDSVDIRNSTLSTSTNGSGDAGNLIINTRQLIVQESSTISSIARAGSEGRAGNVAINAEQVNVLGGAQISASSFGQGQGGNLLLNSDSVNLSGVSLDSGRSSGLFTTSEAGAGNRGGEIRVNAKDLRIADGAVVNARSQSNFPGGDIIVNTHTLDLIGGGKILATAFSAGDAGNITVNVIDRISLAGSDPFATIVNNSNPASGFFADTAIDSTGAGGNILVNASEIILAQGAGIAVSSQGSGEAGNLEIQANLISLDNQAFLTAETSGGEGGNIRLQTQDLLLLSSNSQISTTARGTGSGGNITINTPFLVALPEEGLTGSDITANSFGAQGGAINITAEGVFGLQIRDTLSDENDITAFSQLEAALNGTITLNLPEIDPSRGLIELPSNIVDSAALIAQNPCRKEAASAFIIKGRGGLPSSIPEDLSSEAVQVELVKPVSPVATAAQEYSNSSETAAKLAASYNPIVPAQGWVFNNKGEVVLTAYNPIFTGSQRLRENSTRCGV